MKITNEWISGFIDGDGCFLIQKYKNDLLRHRFIVSQDEKSVDVLYALKKSFGCGSVQKAGGTMMNFEISRQEHLMDRVIPFFYAHPLLTNKRKDFYQFHTSLRAYLEKKGVVELRKRVCTMTPPPTNEISSITGGWFRGFVDADGCFYISIVENRIMPRFLIGAREGHGDLLKECQRFLNCGTLHRRKDGFETLQVSRVEDLEKKLIPHFETRGSAVLLRTIKRIAFQKFRKVIRIMHEKKHLTPEGMIKVIKLQKDLNKFIVKIPTLHSSQQFFLQEM